MTLMKELFGKKGRSRMKRYICEGIVKGATHVRNQMPCQDNKKIIHYSLQPEQKLGMVAESPAHHGE